MANTDSRAWHVAILLALVAVLAVLSVLLVEVKKTPACPAGVGTGAPAAAATHAGVGDGAAAAVSNACPACSTGCVSCLEEYRYIRLNPKERSALEG